MNPSRWITARETRSKPLGYLVRDEPLPAFIYSMSGLFLGVLIGMGLAAMFHPEVALIPIMGLIGITWIGVNLKAGLGLLIFISHARLSDTLVHYHQAPSIVTPLVLGLILMATFKMIMTHQYPSGLRSPFGLMAGYFMACLVSLTSARDLDIALLGVSDLAKDILFALTLMIILKTDREKALETAFWAIILSALLLSAIAVYQYLTQDFGSDFGGLAQAAKQNLSGHVETYRISGTIGDPNFFAQILLIALPLSVDRSMNGDHRATRWLAGVGAILTSLAVLLTFSRGALIGLIGMLALVGIHKRPSLALILGCLCLAMAALLLLPERYLDRLMALPLSLTAPLSSGVEDSLRGRISELASGLLMFMDHPLFGVGLNNYPINYQDYSQQLGYESRHTERHAHNMFLEWMAETGIIGAAFLFSMIWLMFRNLREARHSLRREGQNNLLGMMDAFRLGLIGFLIAGLFLHAAFPRYFWLLAGLAMGIRSPSKTSAEGPPSRLSIPDPLSSR
jgi:O-antigen ligase